MKNSRLLVFALENYAKANGFTIEECRVIVVPDHIYSIANEISIEQNSEMPRGDTISVGDGLTFRGVQVLKESEVCSRRVLSRKVLSH